MAWVKTFPMDSMWTAGVQSCADLRSHKLTWFIAWFIAIYIGIQIIAFWFSLDLTSTLAVYFLLGLVSGKFIISYCSSHSLWILAYKIWAILFRDSISSHQRNILKFIRDLDTFGLGNNTWCETFLTSLNLILDSTLNF